MIVQSAPPKTPNGKNDGLISWPVMVLAAGKIASDGVRAAGLKGWRYCGEKDDNVPVTTQYTDSDAIDSQSPLAQAARDAARQVMASRPANDPKEYYELRELRIPSLHLRAMWLHSKVRAQDYVVPYLSHMDTMEEGQQYTLEQLLTEAGKAARTRKVAPF
jgi:hypothetical protein